MQPDPQQWYRQRLFDTVAALRPGRVLEVGCGGGACLRDLARLDAELVGVDPDPASLVGLRDAGFDARQGRAERLEFADRAFDVVVFCFTAHHIEDWARALVEALRVCAGSVVVLDPWYDAGIASQRVAARFDRWCKAIDRAGGMVHEDVRDAGGWLAPLGEDLAHYEVRAEYLLSLANFSLSELDAFANERLGAAPPRPEWIEELAAIRADAVRDGCSDDGALLLSIGRVP